MDLSELTAYVWEKYHIREEHKWNDFPGFSVLVHPQTGKWVALLMRQWDMDSGTELQRCDLKCGIQSLREFQKAFLSPPFRMKGQKWVGVAFNDATEADVIFRLFDRAFTSGEQRGFTIVLGTSADSAESAYPDTPLPFPARAAMQRNSGFPEKLHEMRRMYEYGRESPEKQAENFYRQGIFMQDYEDDVPWHGDFSCYFPTYHDLTLSQLQGYFTWRTHLRQGKFEPVPVSLAYIYLYELLNGIGCTSPTDSLEKMKSFKAGFLDSGILDARIGQNLYRWMTDFAVIHNLPPETARQVTDPEILGRDASLSVLRKPEDYPDEEVYTALCSLGGKKLACSPVLAKDAKRGMHLFSEAWRFASSQYHWQGKDLFTLCFGEKTIRQWYPLSNTVYLWRERPRDLVYSLNDCRTYRCHGGLWQVEAYEPLSFDRNRFQSFLHEADRKLRQYLKAGHPLRTNSSDSWADVCIDAMIEADAHALAEASKPKITIDFSHLDQIRKDALTTQTSLLTNEEAFAPDAPAVQEENLKKPVVSADLLQEAELPDVQLDAIQLQILCTLLQGAPVDKILKDNRMMPSVTADAINEALFDKIGDSVLLCDGETITLVEDYIDDLTQILGGNQSHD